MSDFDKRPKTDVSDELLDQLLNDAEWPEPDSESIDRLLRHWSSLRTAGQRTERLRKLRNRLAAVAAVIVLAVGVWWLLQPEPRGLRQIAPVAPQTAPEEFAVDEDTGTVAVSDGSAADPPDSQRINANGLAHAESWTSRAATAYELLLVRSAERRGSAPRIETGPTFDSMLDEFLADADGEPATFVASLSIDRATCELKLLSRIGAAPPDQQRQIIELLEHVGSERCIPKLIESSEVAETREQAVRALTILADAATIAELAVHEPDEGVRQQFLSELLLRRNTVALADYLDLLMNGRTRDSALAVLDEQSMPPVDLLFGFLRSPDYSRRMAAAIVLGRLDDPQVTERLIVLAQSPVNRQEAFVGLLVSTDERAGRFLSIARQEQTMIAAVHSARIQLQLMSQQQPRTIR